MPTIYNYSTQAQVIPESVEAGIEFNTQISVNSLTGYTQTMELPGARWNIRMNYSSLLQEESRQLSAFLSRLRGSSGRFYLHDYSKPTTIGTASGSATLTTVVNSGVIRVTHTAGSLAVGDNIQIGTDEYRELKIIVAASQVSGSLYEYVIEPTLRWRPISQYETRPVIYTNPSGTFMLKSDDQAQWASRTKIAISDMTVDCVEIFPRPSEAVF